MPQIFTFFDYKKYLHALLDSHQARGFRSSLVAALKCQKSFFSQVINGPSHFTPDHAANLVDFLALDELSAQYFIDLVNLARAGTPALQERLKKSLAELRDRALQPSERLKWPSINESQIQSVYYSSWIFAAIHVAVSVDRFQSAEKLSERFLVSLRLVNECLDWLIQAKLISKTRSGYKVIEHNLHLKSNSHLNEMHHSHWRNRALLSLQRGESNETHYSAVFAMSRSDFNTLRSLSLEFIKGCTKVIAPSSSEEVYALGLDLYRV
jgi:uncharacterized protein (TIGR02147 family)